MKKTFSVKRISTAFKYAFAGCKSAFHEEPNMKIHLLISIFVILAGFIFKISHTEWIILIFTIGLVLGAELLNTALENMVDLATKTYHEKAKIIKDTAAAYVMVLSFTAIIIGLIIFMPKITAWIGG